jgi:hypothetical protein
MEADDQRASHIPRSLLLAIVGVLAVVFAVAAIAREAAQLGPRVGDVVAFEPGHPIPFDSQARLTASRPGQVNCVLDVAMMQRSGGSLMVEQRGGMPDLFYHAHWAGPRTSADSDDCGAEADLVLSQIDINALAAAAGGFGVEHTPVSR